MFDSYSWVDLSFITASCLIVGALFHRKRRNKRHEHENLNVQEINRIDAHCSLLGFIELSDARNFTLQTNCSPFIRSIGSKSTWTFNLCESFSEAVECLRSSQGKKSSSTHKNSGTPHRVCVPSQWQCFNVGDTPVYRTVSHIQEYNEILSKKKNPSGYYCHHFSVPSKWDTRQVRLVFGGVDCALYVWVNNLFVGFSKDSRLPAEFDITEAAKFGEKNCVEAIVVKYSDAMLLENQSTWRLNGIFRDVHLLSLPRPVCISDYSYTINDITNNSNEVGGRYLFTARIKLNWDLDSADNQFGQESSSVYPRQNFVATSAEWILSSYLYHEGILISSTVGSVESVDSSPHYFGFDKSTSKPVSKVQEYVYLPTGSSDSFPARHSHSHNLHHFRDANTVEDEDTESHLSTPLATSGNKITAAIMQVHEVKAPKLWSAERPNVYTLVMSLRNTTDGSIVQAESCRVAFRSVDVNYGLLRVNAKPLMIRGTNLYEHDPYRGSAVSPRVMEADIQLMKRNNINAIRTANYPHDSWLYELCTLYGLYVINEANICTNVGVGAGDSNVNILADDSDWEKAYMLRLVRMYERDKVHASIIAWSLGSDSGYGRVHDKMANWIGDRDTSRLVMYEPASYGPRVSSSANSNINPSSKKLNIVKSKHKRANPQMATDILCPKYARVSECIVLGNRYPDMPLILMEYSDMRGNSGGNLMDYWTAFNDYTRLQGGFLFSWSDQGLCLTNSRNDSYWGGVGHFGGVVSQTTTDPTYSRWGNNPPGQGSPLGLYEETPLLQLAQRHSIKGRTKDAHCTPFTNGFRQGTTPYPYIRYGSEKVGAAASAVTAGGLTWPDRGIQDISIFEAHDTVMNVESKPSASSSTPPENKASYRYPDMYGLCPPPLYHKSFYKLLFTTALSDDSLVLSQAIAKPQLLEAKFCMAPFDCFIETVKVTEVAVQPVVLNQYNHKTATFEPVAPTIPDSCKLSEMKIFTKLNVINLLDHVDDIKEELSFDALLLCNGLVVCASTIRPEASAVVHRTYNEETGRPTFQELEALGEFTVTVTATKISQHGSVDGDDSDESCHKKKTLCGIKCPEDILLVPYCKEDINELIKNATVEFKETLSHGQEKNFINKALSRLGKRRPRNTGFMKKVKECDYLTTEVLPTGCSWSIVVIGRTLADTSWAPRGFPLGFKQCKISNKCFQPTKKAKNSPPAAPAVVPSPEVNMVAHVVDDKQSSKLKKNGAPKRKKSITRTPTGKKKYTDYELPLSSPTMSTGIPMSQAVDVSHNEENYDISVLWVDSVHDGSCDQESDPGSDSDEKDILLRAVALDKGASSVSRQGDAVEVVEVRVSGRTGSLVSYQVDGVELLSSSSQCDPSCFQLHRAPTVVDRGGYLAAWQAVGMDKGFTMQPLAPQEPSPPNFSPKKSKTNASKHKKKAFKEAKKHCPAANESLTGSTALRNVQVDHVFVHQQSPGRDGSSSSSPSKKGSHKDMRSGFGQGIECKWQMAPAHVDKGRALLLLQIQQFVNDSRVRSKIIEVRSNGQEAFVHEIARTFRLGRESLSPYSEKNQDSSQLHALSEEEKAAGMKAKMYLDYIRIRLWKVAFFPSSTIPYVDTLAIGPFGGLKYDEVDVDDEDDPGEDNILAVLTSSKKQSDLYSAAYYDSFDDNVATELLSANSPSHLSKPMRKNEANLNLNSDFDSPNESESKGDSKESGGKKDGRERNPSLRALFTVKYCVAYLLDEHATLLLRARVDVSALPCPLPRIGLQLRVDPDVFTHANWLGYGPHENYPDRKFSCLMAVHGSNFGALGVPYMIPGENGARGGLEWLQLLSTGRREGRNRSRRDTNECLSRASRSSSACPSPVALPDSSPGNLDDKKDKKDQKDRADGLESVSDFLFSDDTILRRTSLPDRELVIRCSRPFSFSILPCTTEQLSSASNSADLLKYERESNQACINIDPYLMGIGGDDTCSSCVHDDYLVHPDKYDFQLAFSVRNSS
mmetsp:Transcript_13788/g.22820  ORF Transcript_13788/g.22820 Transcript_13788/m.22820 type:complete len:1982 (+) Transcript_13788:151-6096(+)